MAVAIRPPQTGGVERAHESDTELDPSGLDALIAEACRLCVQEGMQPVAATYRVLNDASLTPEETAELQSLFAESSKEIQDVLADFHFYIPIAL